MPEVTYTVVEQCVYSRTFEVPEGIEVTEQMCVDDWIENGNTINDFDFCDEREVKIK